MKKKKKEVKKNEPTIEELESQAGLILENLKNRRVIFEFALNCGLERFHYDEFMDCSELEFPYNEYTKDVYLQEFGIGEEDFDEEEYRTILVERHFPVLLPKSWHVFGRMVEKLIKEALAL